MPEKISPQRKRLLIYIAGIFIILAIIYLLYYLFWGQFHDYTDDAYVAGNVVIVMPRVSGTVTQINTDDTKLVNQGETVVQLDDSDAKIALEHAAANLALTVRRVRQYYATAELNQANFNNAKLDFNRRQGLTKGKVISSDELQHYSIALQEAKAQLVSAEALIHHTNLYKHPEVLNAKANFKTAYLNLKRTAILSPVTGYVAKRSVQVGQEVTPGTALLAIIPLNDLWVNANYKESQLENLRIGQHATMEADAFSGVTFHGKVVGLSSGTGSAFDLLPPQNATGNWIKIVQRLPVRISLDPKELAKYPLRIGLSMRVTVNTSDTKGKALPETANTQSVYATDVYINELQNADAEADKIIQDNAPDTSYSPLTTPS